MSRTPAFFDTCGSVEKTIDEMKSLVQNSLLPIEDDFSFWNDLGGRGCLSLLGRNQ